MREIVINTGPVIALVAATDSLMWLSELYDTVWMPQEVSNELAAGGPNAPELQLVVAASAVIRVLPALRVIPRNLANELDRGEASVIQTALEQVIQTVAIDEKAGRRVARLHGLRVTGSLGILVKAKEKGLIENLAGCLSKMKSHGIWITDELFRQVMCATAES